MIAAAIPAAAFAAPTSMSPVESAKLTGKAEVPKGSSSGSGIVVLHLDAKKGTVCWVFQKVAKIDKPSAAHIHKGAAGKAGPVVVPLGTAYKVKGCAKGSSATIAAIEEHPGRYYVNIHTAKFPAGAIRGQLVVGMLKG